MSRRAKSLDSIEIFEKVAKYTERSPLKFGTNLSLLDNDLIIHCDHVQFNLVDTIRSLNHEKAETQVFKIIYETSMKAFQNREAKE